MQTSNSIRNSSGDATSTDYSHNNPSIPPSGSLLTQKMQNIANTITQSFSSVYRKAATLTSEPFFIKAQHEEEFKNYQNWCVAIRGTERKFLAALKTKNMELSAIQAFLLAQQEDYEKNIVSPLFYQQRLTKLAEKMPFAKEVNAQFRKKLEVNPESALRYFYNDIFNHLVQFSGSPSSSIDLESAFSYYQGLVPNEIYQAVIKQLQQFIEAHQDQLNANPYANYALPSHQYEALLAKINAIFSQAPEQTDGLITPRFLAIATIAAVGVVSYQTGLNVVGKVFVDTLSGSAVIKPLTLLSQAAMSYGLSHQLALPSSALLSTASVLASSFFAYSQAHSQPKRVDESNSGILMNEGDESASYLKDLAGSNDFEIQVPEISNRDINGDSIADVLIGDITYNEFGRKGKFPSDEQNNQKKEETKLDSSKVTYNEFGRKSKFPSESSVQ